MARSAVNTSLADLEVVVDKMRKLGVASWANSPVGDVILGVDPEHMEIEKQPSDPQAQRRGYYQEVFGRPVGDDELKRLP